MTFIVPLLFLQNTYMTILCVYLTSYDYAILIAIWLFYSTPSMPNVLRLLLFLFYFCILLIWLLYTYILHHLTITYLSLYDYSIPYYHMYICWIIAPLWQTDVSHIGGPQLLTFILYSLCILIRAWNLKYLLGGLQKNVNR